MSDTGLPLLPWLVLAAIVALVAIVLAVWHLRFWRKRLSVPMDYADRQVLCTDDGALIELRRLSRNADASGRPPVLLVHGICANHRNVDVTHDRSLARFLQREGRDVWLVSLRTATRQPRRLSRQQQRFKAMARYDLPAAIETILTSTKARHLDYVGFSMGGMLLYAALARSVDETLVRRAVIIGSPAVPPPLGLLKLVRHVPYSLTPTLPVGFVSAMLAFALDAIPRPLKRIVYNPQNTDALIARQSMVDVVENLPGGLGANFVRWAHHGEIRIDGENVLERLAHVSVPARFFAGSTDVIAPVSAVEAAYAAWGSQHPNVDKRFSVLGNPYGHAADYGHADLTLGFASANELFEPLAAFLRANSQRRGESAASPTGQAFFPFPGLLAHDALAPEFEASDEPTQA